MSDSVGMEEVPRRAVQDLIAPRGENGEVLEEIKVVRREMEGKRGR